MSIYPSIYAHDGGPTQVPWLRIPFNAICRWVLSYMMHKLVNLRVYLPM